MLHKCRSERVFLFGVHSSAVVFAVMSPGLLRYLKRWSGNPTDAEALGPGSPGSGTSLSSSFLCPSAPAPFGEDSVVECGRWTLVLCISKSSGRRLSPKAGTDHMVAQGAWFLGTHRNNTAKLKGEPHTSPSLENTSLGGFLGERSDRALCSGCCECVYPPSVPASVHGGRSAGSCH